MGDLTRWTRPRRCGADTGSTRIAGDVGLAAFGSGGWIAMRAGVVLATGEAAGMREARRAADEWVASAEEVPRA